MMKYIFSGLTLITIMVWAVVFQLPDDNLHLIVCDVGQGDAILVSYKDTQILTDGGIPNGKVIECLSRHLPFWDRRIEVVVNTHPQLDHYGGLIEVFKRYKVDYFIGNALDSSAYEYEVLRKEVGSGGTKVINPIKGTSIRSGLIQYDIHWPTSKFLSENGYSENINKLGIFSSKRDPNDFSIQAILSLGEFRALLTGDVGQNIADMVIPEIPKQTVHYIKVSHHGSKYGMTQDYLKLLMPKVAVISVGKDNRYGHPTKEILDLLDEYQLQTFRTDISGDIEVVSNGKEYWVSN